MPAKTFANPYRKVFRCQSGTPSHFLISPYSVAALCIDACRKHTLSEHIAVVNRQWNCIHPETMPYYTAVVSLIHTETLPYYH